MTTPELRMGIYRHYKGALYQVLGLAHDANANGIYGAFENGERIVVVYIALQLDAKHLGPRLAVRTLADFTALVGDGGVVERSQVMLIDEPVTERFTYLGPVLTAEMLT